jgi:N-methylhydantoinase A
VAFGRGGALPTVTDAHVALGNIAAHPLSDAVRIDVEAARGAVAALAATVKATTERTAEAIIAAADAAMARALRRVSVERGIDPRSCVLVAFGGGGPLHACGLADRLGMTRVLVPPHAGVLSALGLAVAPERRTAMGSVMRTLEELTIEGVAAMSQALAAQAGSTHPAAWIARMRYRGQGHELEVPYEPGSPLAVLREHFTKRHFERYGFVLEVPIEVVSARCVRSGMVREVALARRGPGTWVDGQFVDDGGPVEATLHGRCVVALPDATMLVPAGWTAQALPIGGWMVERASG